MAADSQKPNIMPLERYTVNFITSYPEEGLTGRRKILTPVKQITAANVRDVLGNALSVHARNAAEITYLYDVYRGRQDVLKKTKQVRENINHKVVVNRANEIVTFKTAFLLNEPVQYVSHGGDDSVSEKVDRLNEMMRAEDKAAKDKEIVDWMHICGVGERLVQPDPELEYEGAPFNIETLDPREAFCIYNSGIGRKKIGGVILQEDEDGEPMAFVYTPISMFIVRGDSVTEEPHMLGAVPLIEYLNNEARIGAFEVVLPVLNSINQLESDACDAVTDFVNGFDVFQNCEISNDTYGELTLGGKAISIKTVVPGMEAKVYRIFSELNQSGVQTRIDDQTDAYLEICGMPNRNGGSSTSDTGTAVLYRDGFWAAGSRAKDTATMFKRAEREFDKIVMRICDTRADLGLKISDFEAKFPFGNLQNLQSLAQTFTELLSNDYVHPASAYEVGAALFKDSNEALRMGLAWHDKVTRDQEESLGEAVNNARTEALRNMRQGDTANESPDDSTVYTDESEATDA